jgi:alpha-ketoglutaric semialdehyde dehydrogenase
MPTEDLAIVAGRSIIGFSIANKGTESARAINPSTGQELDPPIFSATREEVEQAASLSQQAFLEYSQKSGKERARFLYEIADQIESLGDALTQRAMQETGLPEARIKGETARTTGQLRLFASLAEEGSWVQARIDTAIPDRQPLPKPDVRSMLRPLGPVVVFAASNFPLAFSTAGGDTASALAAGCPVIVKAHSSHPGTAEFIAQAVRGAAERTGMPDGVFSLLFGGGRTVGSALVSHPAVKAVGFTGSTAGGTALMKLASERPEPIPVYAEMGSVNPVVMLPRALEANTDDIASGLHVSATMGVGQFCTNPGIVLVERSETGDQFVQAFTEKMRETADQVMLNASIREAYAEGVAKLHNNAQVETLVSRSPSSSKSACLGSTAVFSAEAQAFLEDDSLSEEIFGPGTTLIRWSDKSELLRLLEKFEGQLTGTIHGTDEDLANFPEAIAILERKVGRIVYNGFPTGVEVCHSMVHGGPFPATSDGRSTSVGTHAITRFARLIAYQASPQDRLPDELKDTNPLGIHRLVNGAQE